MKKAFVVLLAFVALLVLATMVATASTGSGVAAAAPVPQASTPGTVDTIETCTVCHKRSGAEHQTFYNSLYQDGVITVTDLAYTKGAAGASTVTFKLLKNGQPVNPKDMDALSIYWAPFADGKFQFEPARDRLSLKGKVAADGKGVVTSTLTGLPEADQKFVDATDLSKEAGALVVYGRDGTIKRIPGTRVDQAQFPFIGLLTTGTVDYASTANDAGCVKCHTDPYLKHGYIYAQVNDDPKTDFVTCKVCHLDNGEGGHFEWQLLVNDPVKAAEFLAAGEEEGLKLLSEDELKLYAYNPSVMNDVHMSHAMEFPYPQSMANCATCHEGKLDTILTDANFTAATCKSCHPTTGAKAEAKEGEEPAWDTTPLALDTLIGEKHPPIDWLNPVDCATCHKAGGLAADFKTIHPGYDTTVYNEAGIRYSDAISVTIGDATFANNKLTVDFSAAATKDVTNVDVTKNMTPTVIVSLYGWGTRDFLVGGHERLVDDNKDGKIDRSDQRALEAEFGAETANPRVKFLSGEGGKWQVEFDLTGQADLIKNGAVRRLEFGVLPATFTDDGKQVAVNAVTQTFDLGDAAWDDAAFKPIADVAKCESCHGALATNFHDPSYGGSVVACRMCHITKSGGSHLEMQSRALDSYVHAIHAMQPFDTGDINFDDPVQAVHYEHHIGMPYPTHQEENCESCHLPRTYEAPDQATALPGILSASSENETWDRRIGTVPSMIVGPATTACGGCHRAHLINEDKAGNLAALNKHFTQGGYEVPAGADAVKTWTDVTNKVMELFK